MRAEGLSTAAIEAFKYNFGKLTSGESLFVPETSIEAVSLVSMLRVASRASRKVEAVRIRIVSIVSMTIEE